jgi:hypothetical protein
MKRLLVLVLGIVVAQELGAARIEDNPQREMIVDHLKRIAARRPGDPSVHFFVAQRKKTSWIFWREGRLVWETILEPYFEKKGRGEISAAAVWGLRFSLHKAVDLGSSVVPDDFDRAGSSFLEPRSYVADIVYDCVLNGELVEVRQGGPLPGVSSVIIRPPTKH